MRKYLVVDTSVLLYDKNSIHSFPGNDVVLPLTVLDELDHHKEKPGLLGENARYVNRYLDQLREQGRLDVGVRLADKDQTIRVLTDDHRKLAEDINLDTEEADNRIVSAALYLDKMQDEKQVKIVTKDINLRVKCDALGIRAEDYYKDHISSDSQDSETHSILQLELDDNQVNELYSQGYIETPESVKDSTFNNCYAVCKSPTGSSVLCTQGPEGDLRLVKNIQLNKFASVKPRNKEQNFALDSLLNDSIKLVCLTGIAGSGKTYLTLMSALDRLYSGQYKRIVVTRSIQPVGKELGFLPGDLQDKMAPWMAPLIDNFRHAFSDISYFETMRQKGQIDIAPLSFIRGRSFSDCFIIVDEAQNTTIHELKTIVTRVGDNSKIVLLGDTEQIDTPYIDKRSNGLSVVIDRLKGSELASHIHLPKGERSKLATLASKIL